MAYRGPNAYLTAAQTAGASTLIYRISDQAGSALTTLSMPQQTGTTSGVKIVQLSYAGGSSLSANTATGTNAANAQGWWIDPTTDMAGTAATPRVLPAGSALSVRASVTASGLTGNNVLTATFYKVNWNGTTMVYNNLGQGNAACPNSALGTVTAAVATLTLASDVTFAVNDTLYVEVYLQIAAQTVTAGTSSLTMSSSTPWTLNIPNGIGYRYTRATSDTAPVTSDATTRTVTFPRATSDTLATSDAVTRTVRLARSTADSAPAADAATRQLIYVRRVYDGAPADPPVLYPTKAIAGVVRDGTGTAVAGATVKLVRQSDDYVCQQQTSAADGSYSFPRDTFDTAAYYVLAYKGTAPQLHGVTDRGLTPA